MRTLIYTSALGLLCMLAEMLSLRRFIVPVAVTGLLLIFGLNLTDWGRSEALYNNMVVVDNYSVAFSGLFLLVGAFIVLMGGHYFKNEAAKISDYVAILVFALCGAIALVSFGNLAMFFLGIEVLSISLYVLAASRKKDVRSNEAGMKYFLMGSFASGILLFGIALIYAEAATFDINDLGAFVAAQKPSVTLLLGVGMILTAMLFKVSAAPFHFWAPDVYEGSPTIITAFMATVAKMAAFAAFYRLFSLCFIPAFPVYAWVLSAVAALTITIGNLSALNQDSFKRMLAYSGIANAGYLLMALLSMYGNTQNAVFYYAFAYSFASVAAFAVAIIVTQNSGSEKIEAFNGLGKRKPFLALMLTVAMLSLAGIPPMAGFFAKYFVFSEAVRNGHLILTGVAVVNSVIAVYYYMKVVVAMYVQETDERVFSVNPVYYALIAVAVLIAVAAGIFPAAVSQLL